MYRMTGMTLVLLCLGCLNGRAAEKEERTFAVILGGKKYGTATMTIEPKSEGTESFSISVEAKGRISLVSFHYIHNATELWKNGKLISVDSKTNDDGKKTTLSGKSGDTALRLTVNGKERTARSDAVTTSGWRLPGRIANGDRLTMLDTEDGTETIAKVEDRGKDQVTLDRILIPAHKYKLTGKDLDAEWWFDENGRPVRQHLVWDGHKVTLELTGIKR